MTPAHDRRHVAALIDEAVSAGARFTAACAALGLNPRTLQRWRDPVGGICEDRRPSADRPAPTNRLSEAERDKIVATCNAPEFASLPPSQIVPRLADRGDYIASESSFYRVLRERGQNHRRGRARPATRPKPPTSFEAKAPCQVWSWDITWLPGPIAGTFFYLYLIVDIFSRKIVGWEVHDRETADFAALVLKRAVWSEKCLTNPLVLHADNGSPMKGATMKVTMERLGVTASFSRPRVSNDNPFSEALFRTCKYTPGWPTRGFATIEEAQIWVQTFVTWYNTEHRHSAIRFVTPDQRHRGEEKALLAERHRVYQMARAVHPERWSGQTRDWQPIGSVWLNPERPDAGRRGHGAADALPHEAGGGGPMAGPAENAA
ncbi:putative transposase OrfB [Jannaschia seosinensis]|uniref:Putative transposase OrfB n=2 Tax=Jannaschia seosinensis TaxID=313367 RepID=A0A0M7BI08_9RHOB|nr:putative transposase OrfB [Jannaschia seosinensis]